CCYFVILIYHVVPFIVLAFLDLSSLRTHFWPFTEVVRRIRREVTREIGRPGEPQIAQTPNRKNRYNQGTSCSGWIERRRTRKADGTFALAYLRHGNAGRGESRNRLSYKSHRPGATIFR